MTDRGIARRFSVGSVLSVSLGVLFANFLPFIVLGLIILAPVYLYAYYWPTLHPTTDQVIAAGAITLLEHLAGLILTASLIYGTVQELRGRRATLASCLARGIGLILPVVAVSVVVLVCVMLGTLLLIVPGLIVATMLWVAIPVAVVERPGVFQSLGRSAELTKGRRWSVFGIIILIVIFSGIVDFIVRRIFTPEHVFAMESLIPFFVANWFLSAFIAAFGACLAGVGYYFLRHDKEGAEIDQIAAVFD